MRQGLDKIGDGWWILWSSNIVKDIRCVYESIWWVCRETGGMTWVMARFVVIVVGVLVVCRADEGKWLGD